MTTPTQPPFKETLWESWMAPQITQSLVTMANQMPTLSQQLASLIQAVDGQATAIKSLAASETVKSSVTVSSTSSSANLSGYINYWPVDVTKGETLAAPGVIFQEAVDQTAGGLLVSNPTSNALLVLLYKNTIPATPNQTNAAQSLVLRPYSWQTLPTIDYQGLVILSNGYVVSTVKTAIIAAFTNIAAGSGDMQEDMQSSSSKLWLGTTLVAGDQISLTSPWGGTVDVHVPAINTSSVMKLAIGTGFSGKISGTAWATEIRLGSNFSGVISMQGTQIVNSLTNPGVNHVKISAKDNNSFELTLQSAVNNCVFNIDNNVKGYLAFSSQTSTVTMMDGSSFGFFTSIGTNFFGIGNGNVIIICHPLSQIGYYNELFLPYFAPPIVNTNIFFSGIYLELMDSAILSNASFQINSGTADIAGTISIFENIKIKVGINSYPYINFNQSVSKNSHVSYLDLNINIEGQNEGDVYSISLIAGTTTSPAAYTSTIISGANYFIKNSRARIFIDNPTIGSKLYNHNIRVDGINNEYLMGLNLAGSDIYCDIMSGNSFGSSTSLTIGDNTTIVLPPNTLQGNIMASLTENNTFDIPSGTYIPGNRPIFWVYSVTKTVSTTSQTFNLGDCPQISFKSHVTAAKGSLTFQLQTLGHDGVWYNQYTSDPITAATSLVASFGAGLQYNSALGQQGRLLTNISGTTPSFTYSISLDGSGGAYVPQRLE